MAGMFYSLREAAEKLNKTEDELRKLVKEGKLREFRDGANLLFKVDEVENLAAEEVDIIGLTEDAGAEASEHEFPDLEIEAPEASELESAEELSMADMAEPFESAEGSEPAEPSETAADTDEILLAPETGAPTVPSELTDADTALTGMGTSVLGETDQDYEVTDDTMAETAIPTGTAGTTPEVPLEEIEEDVNLDTFGSGSGLLDLSLQADDTSLGGILDEIYTAEGEGQEPAEAAAEAAEPAAVEPAAGGPEQMISDDELIVPQSAAEVGVLAAPLIEVAPDSQSNILGMLLFLPLVIVIYTTVVVAAGLNGVIPSILGLIQNFIWYIMGGAAVLALLITGAAFLLTGERSTAVKAEKKPKEPKKAKEPKIKKAKKGKEA